MTPSKIFLFFCISFILGISLGSFIKIPSFCFFGFLIFGILIILFFWKNKKIFVLGFSILFLIFGIWRYQQVESKIINDELQKYRDLNKDITLIGVVLQEPEIREKSQKLIIKVEKIENPQQVVYKNNEKYFQGKILVITKRYPEYQYGDKLKITGKLKTPQVFEEFNYKDYLKKDGIYSQMEWPEIKIIDKNQGNFIFRKILFFKGKLRESIYQNFSPPQSSILGAMILGDKKQISEDLKQKLNIVGLRHITAISGLHVTILSSILMTLLIGLGFWRQQAFYFAIFLIAFFIIMTGLQPSAVRAGIMGFLFLLAQHLGKITSSSRTIFFAAALMLFQNPLLLKLDISFQLSFLAIIGIIYLSPIFQNWLGKIPNILGTRNILAMTLSAQFFTLPILIYNFGYFSLVSPVTNILIVPFLPYIMGLGFISGIVGIISHHLGWFFSLPCWLFLTYLIKIVEFFSKPWAFKTIKISWPWLIIFYLILVFIAWRLQEKQKLKFLHY